MVRFTCLLFLAAAALAGDVNDDLFAAARKGDLAAVKSLIEKGAPVEAKTPYGQTPLYLAAMSGHQDVVRYLLDKGARTDVTDTFYKAPMLDFILYRKHYAIARMLIARGNGKPDDELKTVADAGQADLIQAVIDKGKPSQAALDSAYEQALDQKQTAIAEILKKAGAHEPSPPMAIDAKVLESYTGTFKTEEFPLDIKVFVKEGKLYMQATGQEPFAPRPKSAAVFEFAPAGLEVEFDSPASFTLKQGGRDIKFKRVVAQ